MAAYEWSHQLQEVFKDIGDPNDRARLRLLIDAAQDATAKFLRSRSTDNKSKLRSELITLNEVFVSLIEMPDLLGYLNTITEELANDGTPPTNLRHLHALLTKVAAEFRKIDGQTNSAYELSSDQRQKLYLLSMALIQPRSGPLTDLCWMRITDFLGTLPLSELLKLKDYASGRTDRPPAVFNEMFDIFPGGSSLYAPVSSQRALLTLCRDSLNACLVPDPEQGLRVETDAAKNHGLCTNIQRHMQKLHAREI